MPRLLTHIPDPGRVMTRHYGWYASRTRAVRRRQAAGGGGVERRVEAPVVITDPVNWSLRATRHRWCGRLENVRDFLSASATGPTLARCA